ncbi:MAG: DISARM system helicase DrmA, partial [Phycisphaerales bacterium]|nr:DISARM system helicase DrmA [Phycisphaerales bacterium]
QRVHSLWAGENRTTGGVSGAATTFDTPANRTWRPFQMGFILLNLVGIADERSKDRELVDLLWFPTGGGKTEAYLGLSAFTMALRRLRGERHGMLGEAGVSIIMRYTLRLLTIQQFQRAAALICACELVRREKPTLWGNEPFRIGIWVGRGTTPNTFDESKAALDDFYAGKKPKSGSPVQLVSCPRCGAALVTSKGFPERNTYVCDKASSRTLVWCPNLECPFSATNSGHLGLPVVVVDEEVYRTCPAIVVATVDKFARIPFKGETRALFGLRDRYSPTYGHITEAHGEYVGTRKLRDARPVRALLPPELIIQDELHLISGPLGTMVGLYETVVQSASAIAVAGVRLPPKVIASTATIRRAAQQARQLYARRLAVFPPSALTSKDSFFARELAVDLHEDKTAGRLYVGINAPGSSTKTLLVRVYSALLSLAQGELAADPKAADPYGTLVGYFNSLRALGGAMRLVEDDVSVRLKYLAGQRGLPRRFITEPKELTSRVDSWRIPGLLKELDNAFPRGSRDWPVDVLLATNMISVGVDIDRLGLMVVTGQPKSTAEYIQATSRVGRKHPGLVVTMYNWMGARDLSHYERFESYHAALYRHVEAISVTPFSSRALDRGLRGIFAAMMRLRGTQMAPDAGAQNFDAHAKTTRDVIEEICKRAEILVGRASAALVRDRLLSYSDQWARLAEAGLLYSWLADSVPKHNSRVLLRTTGTSNEGQWPTPGSLREVEPTAAFFLNDEEL